MASAGASGLMLENRGFSPVIKLPKYKRRRVSAVRDFPPGCGPNASKSDINGNAGEIYCVNAQNAAGERLEVESKTALSSSESRIMVPKMLNEELSFDESKNKKTCSAAAVEKSVDAVLKAIEHELMMDEHLSGELLPRSSQTLQVNAEIQEQSKELIEYKQEAMSSVLNKNGKEISVDDLPPLNVTSPTPSDVCKERNYPRRRRVSAVRDFPCGCGPNPSYSYERHYTIAELQRNISVETVKTKLIYDRKMEKEASEASDTGNDTSQQCPLGTSRVVAKKTVLKQVKFKLKPYYYEPKKGTVVGEGKVLRSENENRQKDVASSSADAVARNKVRETLRLFQALTRKFLQREESNSKYIRRVDLHALNILKQKGLYSNAEKPMIGHVPGVEVGSEFHYRVELMIVGIHRHSQGGIDFVKQGEISVATSVVDSGGYDNRVDNYDVWTYTGQGGNLNVRDKTPEDQKLERGNLALKNSIKARNLVRVIRGVKDTKSSKVSTKYTYYGVYTVEKYWQEIGLHGIKEYKFELKRVSGQPDLPWKKIKRVSGVCVNDISKGKEKFPIRAVNTIDAEKPPPFTYTARMIYTSSKPLRTRGCDDCVKGCLNCSCIVKNGGSIPYNLDGAIVEAKPIVYECGPCCKCPSTCYNRVSQLGIIFHLEIFKTETRGWGVRSLASIPSGGFICEYTGELLEDTEAEKRIDNDEYLFDIGQNRNDHSIWDGLSDLISDCDDVIRCNEVVEDSCFTIDAAKYGNVGRFINHSCSPNLYAQNVLYDHGDTRMPHIMLFAAENIPPLQELTYHYNYKLGQVYDRDGNVKVKYCYCGSPNCSGRLY